MRTKASVYLLEAGRGDFRLVGPPDVQITFQEGAALQLRRQDGALFVDMQTPWYEEAARAWSVLPVPWGEARQEADAHLVGHLIAQGPRAGALQIQDMPLVRAHMQVPHLKRRGGEAMCRAARQLAQRLRSARADALRQGLSLYGLRACACLLAQIVCAPIPRIDAEMVHGGVLL